MECLRRCPWHSSSMISHDYIEERERVTDVHRLIIHSSLCIIRNRSIYLLYPYTNSVYIINIIINIIFLYILRAFCNILIKLNSDLQLLRYNLKQVYVSISIWWTIPWQVTQKCRGLIANCCIRSTDFQYLQLIFELHNLIPI